MSTINSTDVFRVNDAGPSFFNGGLEIGAGSLLNGCDLVVAKPSYNNIYGDDLK